MNEKQDSPFLEVVTLGKAVIVSASPSIMDKVKADTMGKSRDEIFEYPYVYGQSLYYIPDFNQLHIKDEIKEFQFELLEENELQKIKYIKGFENSCAFDEYGNTPAKIVLCAYKENEIVAIAGAAAESETMWEMGVDVRPQYRGNGLATVLVNNLTIAILEKGILPFYCASTTNIPSQMVAARCGFLPCWVSSYRNILDGSSCYEHILEKIVF